MIILCVHDTVDIIMCTVDVCACVHGTVDVCMAQCVCMCAFNAYGKTTFLRYSNYLVALMQLPHLGELFYSRHCMHCLSGRQCIDHNYVCVCSAARIQ